MKMIKTWTSFLLLVGYSQCIMGLGTALDVLDVLQRPKKCQLERIAKMIGYTCTALDLREVPQSLKTGMEVLDLSHNRIRRLTKESFSRYTDIKFLYLFENIIMDIEEGTFAQLEGLEALDLSTNALTTIPVELYKLERLRNLYIEGNTLIRLDADLAKVPKPIKAPLQILNLANTELLKIPDFGILPDLYFLNVSGNSLTDISADQFSPLCALRKIDFNETRVPTCQCQVFQRYLKIRNVVVENLTCDFTLHKECPSYGEAVNETIDYFKCQEIRQQRQLNTEAKSKWLWIACCLSAFLFVFISFLYCLHRKNVREIKRRQSLFLKPKPIRIENDGPAVLITEKC